MDKHGIIGRMGMTKGTLPWPMIKEDMEHFRGVTIPNAVIMGRHTWDSLPDNQKPLKKRQNIILSRNKDFFSPHPDVVVASTFADAVAYAKTRRVCIIGGGQVYMSALPFADVLHITYVHGQYNGNVYFPTYNRSEWILTSMERNTADTATGKITFDFCQYERASVTSQAAS